MPTTAHTPDTIIKFSTFNDDGTTLSWGALNQVYNSSLPVVDFNSDGNLDSNVDYWNTDTFPYSGYTINIDGKDYAVFVSSAFGAVYIPFDSTVHDISGFAADLANGSTTTKLENGTAANFCFLGGTMIEMPEGACAVEHLSIGDHLSTADGRTAQVKWIGRQAINPAAANLTLDEALAPVCISAGALGNHTDLYVSADHGMVVDGLVVNASALVNGTTIRFVPTGQMPTEFTYYHIETDAHDVILANGAPSETFVDAVSRAGFDNYAEYLDLYGAERIIPEMHRPRITSRRLLPDAIRARLAIADEETGFAMPLTA